MVEAAPQGNLFCCQSSDGRFYIKLCHFSRPEAVTAAAASTALGRIAVKMADLLMNSAIPSEGSMRTSWPRLRNSGCASIGKLDLRSDEQQQRRRRIADTRPLCGI